MKNYRMENFLSRGRFCSTMELSRSLLLLILFIKSACSEDLNLTDSVSTDKGPVRGKIVRTVQNVTYAVFKGIPYARPPTGYLRFRAPVEADTWTKPLIATSQSNSCPQLQFQTTNYVGNEDCLYLNVYTPKIIFSGDPDELLPVMVWIHGGAFVFGDCGYNPDFLVEENIVIVSINYRLGALGFLSLGHSNATGNAGLKDQVLALKWIRQNIKNFGGDPDRVTISGQSAGAAAVEFHKLSNLSKGLFQRSIAMSGSALNYWAFSPRKEAVSRAFYLGTKLGIVTLRKEDLLKKLYEAPPEELVRATISMTKFLMKVPFKPTYEGRLNAGNDAFISECAVKLYKSDNLHQLPHMMGFTDAEAIAIASYPELSGRKRFNTIMESSQAFSMVLAENRNYTISPAEHNRRGLLSKPITAASNIVFVVDIDRTQQYLSRGSAPVYYYRNSFDYAASLHKIAGINVNGTAHADDIAHIFWVENKQQSLDPTSDIAVHRKRMVRMWSNFVKYGDPTPNGLNDSILNVIWKPSGPQGYHLAISNGDLTMGGRPVDKFVETSQSSIKPIEMTLNGC